MKLPVLKKNISNRALAWMCVAVLLVSLMPLYVLSFYNHACYDDFGFSLLTHDRWMETGSLLATVDAAWDNTVGIRTTWEGTYATSFISALQPALFGEDLYWVTTLVLLTFFLYALWFFMRQVLVRVLHVDRHTFLMALSALAFVMVQFVPEMSEAFFWFNGGVAYTLLWSMALWRFGVWIAFLQSEKNLSRWLYGALLVVLTVVVGGAKYSTLLFAALVDALVAGCAFVRKRRTRWFELAVFVLLMICFIFNMTAPGNTVRAATLGGDVSAPRAVLQAFYFGLALAGSWFSLPLLVVWALVAWQLSDALRGSPFRFSHPVWITIGCICLFCAQLAPTLYTGNYIGDGRTVNTYFYTFVIMSCALVLYWMGWYVRMSEKRTHLPAIGGAHKGLRLGVLAVAMTVLIIGCVGHKPAGSDQTGLENIAGVSALKSLVTGQAQAYDEAMTARDSALRDSEQPEVVLTPVDDIPEAFMGDALESDNLTYVLNLYADYYDKQRVSVAQDE